MEHEDRPLVGRQPAEPAFEQVPVGHAEELVRRRRSVDRQHPEVRGPSTLARRLGDADVDEEALEPRIEAVRIAESPQVTPGDHQRILEGILGPIDVAEDPLGDREQPVTPVADQVDDTPPDPRPAPTRRDHDPRITAPRRRPSGAPSDSTGRIAGRNVHSLVRYPPVVHGNRLDGGILPCTNGSCSPTWRASSCSSWPTARRRSRRSRCARCATADVVAGYLTMSAAGDPGGLRRAARPAHRRRRSGDRQRLLAATVGVGLGDRPDRGHRGDVRGRRTATTTGYASC